MPSGLNDFVIMRALGAGTGGVCRLARRRADQKLYALKELEMPTDQGEAAAVIQEIHILASLEHPFIIRYYDSFIEARKLFLVMEYATHGSLHSVLQRHQRSQQYIGEATLWQYTIQLLLGLHAIHKLRVLHRDVKPHNIFLGANDTVKIGDFGVSRLLTGSADLATTVVGSPGYLAPELCTGEPYDDKADVWALGVTLIELCLLKHPFAGAASQAALVMKIINGDPPPPTPHYSGTLSRLLSTCMIKSTRQRPTALQLLCVPVVRDKAAELGLGPLMPSQRFAPAAGGGSRANGAARACAHCSHGGGSYEAAGGGGGCSARGSACGETQALRQALRQAQLEVEEARREEARRREAPPQGCSPPEPPLGGGRAGAGGRGALPFQMQQPQQPLPSRRHPDGAGPARVDGGGEGRGWGGDGRGGLGLGRGGGEVGRGGAGVGRGGGEGRVAMSTDGGLPTQRRHAGEGSSGGFSSTSQSVSWDLRPVCADKRKGISIRSWHSLLQQSELEEETNQNSCPSEGGCGRIRLHGALGDSPWEGSPTEAQPPQTPPNLWAKRRGADGVEQSPGLGKKGAAERPERLQMLAINNNVHPELQSPLDAFAAKHCPSRSRSVKDSSGNSSNASKGIPETDFDFDFDEMEARKVHSPLSALMKRQFPPKGEPERRSLFD